MLLHICKVILIYLITLEGVTALQSNRKRKSSSPSGDDAPGNKRPNSGALAWRELKRANGDEDDDEMAWSDSTSNPGSPAMSDEPELDRGPSGGVSSQGKTKHAVFQDGYRITLLPTSECDIFRDQGFSWSYHVAGGYVTTTDILCQDGGKTYTNTFNRRSQKATEVTYDGVIAPQAAVKHIRDPLAESKIPAKNPENSGDCLDAANAVKNFLMSGKGQGGFYDFFETLCSFYKMNVFDKIEESDKVDISELKIRV